MLVGVHTQEEQAVDPAALQRLVGFELLDDLRQGLAQIRHIQALGDIGEDIVADGLGPMRRLVWAAKSR